LNDERNGMDVTPVFWIIINSLKVGVFPTHSARTHCFNMPL
jgi:hypothetical protein